MSYVYSSYRVVAAIVVIVALVACSNPTTLRDDRQAKLSASQETYTAPDGDTFWDLQTSLGPITIRLFTDVAPQHAANIVELAGQDYYDGLYFHRVVPGFVAQGGGTAVTGTSEAGPSHSLAQERNPGLSHDRAGLVSMVASGDESNPSQFFIILAPAPWLDELNTIFGEVVSGQETVKAIEEAGSPDGSPGTPIQIVRSSTRIEPTASKQLQEVVADLVRQGVTTPGTEGWRANIPEPPVLELVPGKAYDWLLETAHGTIRIRLASETAPLHSVNLIYLSAFAYFDGLYFNRVVPGFMAQGGGLAPAGPGTRGAAYTVPNERSPDLLHDLPGRVAMVASDTEASTAGQFYITYVRAPWLDEGTTIIGRVIDGFEALTVIETLGSEDGTPNQPIPIIKAWVEESTARKPQEDAALIELQAYVQSQIAAGGISTQSEDWRRELPPYPELTFTKGRNYLWHLETSLGPITLLFFPDVAPQHAASFMYLAELGYFDDLDFHRVIPGFMAQGGWNPQGGPGYTLPTVTNASVRHDRAGVLSMANTGQPNTEGSGFFITFARTPWLDGKHTIFGRVVGGMETVREIEKRGNRDGKPSETITIQRTWVTVE